MAGSKSETQGEFCDGLSSNIVVQYSVGPIITLITARVYPMIQNNNAFFQNDNVPIHTAATVESWFEEPEGEL
jgi:hypothetical protein